MDDSLEALLEKATNPKNTYEDWEFIMAFCDRVNSQADGPQIALKIVVPKIQHENEKVCLLALTLVEACVKNCGHKFHQELGKFRFLNELIRLISPKYLGNKTPQPVLKRIKELLYSWKIGLPHEKKIGEAYEMLKNQGLIFDESVSLDPTLETRAPKPKVALMENPKQSEMLRRLLASKSPEDLRAANRLIRDMVRRDEKRMEKLQKRIESVELIQNNIKLLNELLAHFNSDSREQERVLIEELHNSLEKQRPSLFKMASEVKQDEDGMADILQTNDDLIRVLDCFKRKMEAFPRTGPSQATDTPPSSTATLPTTNSLQGAILGGSGGEEEGGTAGGSGSGNVLIDLADLNFGPPPSSLPGNDVGGGATGGSSLLDSLELLDLPMLSSNSQPTGQNMPPLAIPPLLTGPPSSQYPTPPPPLTSSSPSPSSSAATATPNPPLFPSHTHIPTITNATTPSTMVTIPPPPGHRVAMTTAGATGSNKRPMAQPPSSGGQQQSNLLNSLGSLGTGNLFGSLGPLGGPTQQSLPQGGMGGSPAVGGVGGTGMNSLGGASGSPLGGMGMGMAVSPLGGMGMGQPTAAAVQSDPLAVLDDVNVALGSVQPAALQPLQVVNKNGVTVNFHFTKNSPGPHISVILVSVISMNPLPVSAFEFQAAVPRVMRVKLQPPSGTELGGYNPILPPPSISQLMLLANPTKAKIRMKYRISFKAGGQETVEMGETGSFPQL